MNLAAFLRWLGGTPLANAIDDSAWLFPAIESLHVLGLALLVGTIAVVDLRLLGLGLRSRSEADLARDLRSWTLAGLGVMLATGPLLFCSDPLRYFHNPAFGFKMRVLAAALLAHYTIRRRAAGSRRWQKPAACLSLALWSAVIVGARWIATY
jgi:hypothetical protein